MNPAREGFIDRVSSRQKPHAHSHAENPRIRSCVKCGLSPEAHCHEPTPEPDPSRDLTLEYEFFNDAVRTAVRTTGIFNPGYVDRVMDRLDVGRERYGDANYMHKDVLREVLEETPDIAGYAVLELHKQKALGCAEQRYANLYQDLVAAAAYGCVADHYAQRAARRLAGEGK